MAFVTNNNMNEISHCTLYNNRTFFAIDVNGYGYSLNNENETCYKRTLFGISHYEDGSVSVWHQPATRLDEFLDSAKITKVSELIHHQPAVGLLMLKHLYSERKK